MFCFKGWNSNDTQANKHIFQTKRFGNAFLWTYQVPRIFNKEIREAQVSGWHVWCQMTICKKFVNWLVSHKAIMNTTNCIRLWKWKMLERTCVWGYLVQGQGAICFYKSNFPVYLIFPYASGLKDILKIIALPRQDNPPGIIFHIMFS